MIEPQTKYIALLDNILHRLRFAKFVAIVRNELGPEVSMIYQHILVCI